MTESDDLKPFLESVYRLADRMAHGHGFVYDHIVNPDAPTSVEVHVDDVHQVYDGERWVTYDDIVSRLTAGADPTPVEPGTWPTPGQYIHHWNQMTEAERLDEARQVIEDRQMMLEHLMYPRRWTVNGEPDPELEQAIDRFRSGPTVPMSGDA